MLKKPMADETNRQQKATVERQLAVA